VKKAATFDGICSSNYKKTFFTEVWAPLSTIQEALGRDFPVLQTFHYLLDGMVPYSSLCYVSVIVMCHFCLINPLIFLCFNTGNSQATIIGWLAMSVFPFLKYFTHHLTQHQRMHLHLPVDIMHEYVIWEYPPWLGILSLHVIKLNVLSSYFLVLTYDHTKLMWF
jgi:hypothetical protein